MTLQDITPPGSCAPVYLDPNPPAFVPEETVPPAPPVVHSPSGIPFAITVDDEGNIIATPVEP